MLDIYLPKIEKPKYPVVICIYGSAWFSNNLKESALATLGKILLDNGFAVVTPNHRSSYDAKYPAQIQDIKAAIRFIRANAEKYQLDTSFIGTTGFSSGGHLAALAGTSGGMKQYTIGSVTFDIEGDIGSYTSYSSSVDAVVDWFGPTDFIKMDSCATTSTIDHNSPNAPEAILIGGPVQENKEKCVLANPITYIDSNDPPFLIFHGDKDPLVPYCQSVLLHNALKDSGVASELIIVPGGGHGDTLLFNDINYKKMADFFLNEYNKTKINRIIKDKIYKYSIFNLYPNPSNNIINVSFYMKMELPIEIKIFNLIGQCVMRINLGKFDLGNHLKKLDMSKFQSGIYIMKITTGRDNYVKKIAILN